MLKTLMLLLIQTKKIISLLDVSFVTHTAKRSLKCRLEKE